MAFDFDGLYRSHYLYYFQDDSILIMSDTHYYLAIAYQEKINRAKALYYFRQALQIKAFIFENCQKEDFISKSATSTTLKNRSGEDAYQNLCLAFDGAIQLMVDNDEVEKLVVLESIQ